MHCCNIYENYSLLDGTEVSVTGTEREIPKKSLVVLEIGLEFLV